MKVWIREHDLKYLEEMQDEGRTRTIEISSFRRFDNDTEIEYELNKKPIYEEEEHKTFDFGGWNE